ncbi:hypothetical protein L1987_54815 [Smallanthus sonchifolius]|uniref:Uncharacterized protein n=1 Tax=Smallanthus sonchifolius TaxID=185202 RepID=A0ACB9E987_9ASTR|nr:hypothetical protein L1987_54815 [Smallanthus sonchifolius]
MNGILVLECKDCCNVVKEEAVDERVEKGKETKFYGCMHLGKIEMKPRLAKEMNGILVVKCKDSCNVVKEEAVGGRVHLLTIPCLSLTINLVANGMNGILVLECKDGCNMLKEEAVGGRVRLLTIPCVSPTIKLIEMKPRVAKGMNGILVLECKDGCNVVKEEAVGGRVQEGKETKFYGCMHWGKIEMKPRVAKGMNGILVLECKDGCNVVKEEAMGGRVRLLTIPCVSHTIKLIEMKHRLAKEMNGILVVKCKDGCNVVKEEAVGGRVRLLTIPFLSPTINLIEMKPQVAKGMNGILVLECKDGCNMLKEEAVGGRVRLLTIPCVSPTIKLIEMKPRVAKGMNGILVLECKDGCNVVKEEAVGGRIEMKPRVAKGMNGIHVLECKDGCNVVKEEAMGGRVRLLTIPCVSPTIKLIEMKPRLAKEMNGILVVKCKDGCNVVKEEAVGGRCKDGCNVVKEEAMGGRVRLLTIPCVSPTIKLIEMKPRLAKEMNGILVVKCKDGCNVVKEEAVGGRIEMKPRVANGMNGIPVLECKDGCNMVKEEAVGVRVQEGKETKFYGCMHWGKIEMKPRVAKVMNGILVLERKDGCNVVKEEAVGGRIEMKPRVAKGMNGILVLECKDGFNMVKEEAVGGGVQKGKETNFYGCMHWGKIEMKPWVAKEMNGILVLKCKDGCNVVKDEALGGRVRLLTIPCVSPTIKLKKEKKLNFMDVCIGEDRDETLEMKPRVAKEMNGILVLKCKDGCNVVKEEALGGRVRLLTRPCVSPTIKLKKEKKLNFMDACIGEDRDETASGERNEWYSCS